MTYNLLSAPTAFFKGGIEVKRLVGSHRKAPAPNFRDCPQRDASTIGDHVKVDARELYNQVQGRCQSVDLQPVAPRC